MSLTTSAFERVFDAQPVVSLVLDRAGTVVAATDALLHLTGAAREGLLGHRLTPEVLAPFGAAWCTELKDLLEGTASPQSLAPVFFPLPAHSPYAGLLPWWTPQLVAVPGPDGAAADYVVCSAQQTLAPVPSSPLVSPLAPRLAELQFILDQVPAHIMALLEPTHVPAYVSPSMRQLFDNRPRVGTPLAETMPELVDPGLVNLFDEVYRTGDPLVLNDFPVSGIDTPTFRGVRRYFDFLFHPLRTAEGKVTGVLLVVLETTDRMRTRQRLAQLGDEVRRQEAQFQVLTETLPHISSSADAAGHNTYTSPQWFSYTGQDPALSGDVRWTLAVHPDDLPRVAARFREALAAGAPWEVDFRLRRHDGMYRWHQTRTRPALDPDGTLLGWHGVTVDVHDRTLADEALRRSQAQLARQDQRLQQILGQVPAIIATTEGPEHRYAFSNPGHQVLVRRTVVLGRTVAEMWPEPQSQNLTAVLDDVYRTGRTESGTEVKVTTRDPETGELVDTYLDRTFQAMRDGSGRIYGILAFAVDVTTRVLARQRAEALQEEMRRRDEQLLLVAATVPTFMYSLDPAGALAYINPYFFEYAGLPAETGPTAFWSGVHPDEADAAFAAFRQAVAAHALWECEFRYRRHDGRYEWFHTRAQPVFAAEGQLQAYSGTSTLIEQQHTLREELHRREEQLRQQNEELTRNNQDLDNFVYAASHDLKQPVDNLAGLFGELRRSSTFAADDDELLRRLESAIRQLRTTIDDLTTVGQVQRQPQLPTDSVDFAELTREVLSTHAPQVQASGARISTHFAELPALAYARSDLRTILTNLLGNALKYAHPDRRPDIRVRTYLDGPRPVLLVSDNGVGLDVERHRDELFHIFQRFHSHVGGTGVGLYLVNRLVRNYGGHVEVESEVGQGATFRVCLRG
jgi:PAS domain S-box-containing protein